MKSEGFNSTIADGTDQDQREPPAFREDYFNVDEMSFEMLLAMASEYAASINYYDSTNQKDGSWAELFNANEAVIMALIATCDVDKIESDFVKFGGVDVRMAANYVISVAATLDFWLQGLASATTASAVELRNNIHEVIKSNLLTGLHTAVAVEHNFTQEIGSVAAGLSPIWALSADVNEGGASTVDQFVVELQQLEMALLRMTGAIRHLKAGVGEMLEHSLRGQSHEPAIGLFMVFLHLYEVAQQRLNRFTRRHLAFYYRDCLKSAPRGRKAESVFLKFEPAVTASPFVIDQHAEFSATKKISNVSQRYHLKVPLLVRRAAVRELYTLYLQRNPLVSPECELGHVSRIKSHHRSLPTGDPSVMSLFGVAKRGAKQRGMADASVGFCIASSMLALKEGRREVTVQIDFSLPGAVEIEKLFSDAAMIRSSKELQLWFGKVFSYYLLSGEAFLNSARLSQIERLIYRFDCNETYTALLQQSWADLFYKLLSKPFAIELSGENGWLSVKEYLVSPIAEEGGGENGGIKIIFSLNHNVESIVAYDAKLHGGNHLCTLPMMNISLDPEANFFSYSLLNSLTIKRIGLDVSAAGVKELAVSNQLGRIDPAKPFSAFGPIPSRNAYMIIGSKEAASKPVTEMRLTLVWDGLPTLAGGFSTYYDGYHFVPHNSDFKADISVLQNGRWMPANTDSQYRVGLFSSGDDGKVCDRSELAVCAADYFKAQDVAEAIETFEYRGRARNGFVRLQMSSPQNGFGHADYPLLLTRVLTENSRRKKPLPVPNAPYTPMISQLSISYTARSLIRLGIDASTGSRLGDGYFFHMHPFGVEQIYPAANQNRVQLFPRYEEDGNLFVGVEAQNLDGRLTLFFELDEDASYTSLTKKPVIHWSYLTGEGWQPLGENRVISDSTEGFLMSGVVTLNLPQGMVSNSTLMPCDRYWLRVSCNDNLQGFCGVRSVTTNVAQLSYDEKENNFDGVVDDNNWRAIKTIPGLAAVQRVSDFFGGRHAEDERDYRLRMSERLRHKGRASSAWDYERLILANFPDIHKVKCFPNTVCDTQGPMPGNILIVVIPHMKRHARSHCEKGVVNRAVLAHIREYVQTLSSAFVQIDVRNPVYERIQVRCSVKFRGDVTADGDDINRLNQAVSDYICPWCDVGYRAKFGWTIRADDIESYIRELDYVAFVTNFSMLHISEERDEKFSLTDSAKLDSLHKALIKPRYPWSLAVPMAEHFIEITKTVEPISAQQTGVNELEIGATFIIGGD